LEDLALSRNNDDIAGIRQFQSETAAIREAPEPRAPRIAVWLLAGLVISLVVLSIMTRLDRVVSSASGKTVPTQPVNVYQALDPSIIKTIDVREGDLVQTGQLLATLDPTFAAADVKQLQRQIASLTAQIARDEAELAGKPLIYPVTDDPDLRGYQELQLKLHVQMILNYKAQINSFDSKIEQAQATIAKYNADTMHYGQREQVAKQIEDIRLKLETLGLGSRVNRLATQDQRLEMQRFEQFGSNSLVEAQGTLASTKADREAFVQKWSTDLSQELVKARGDLDSATAQLEKAARKQDLVRLTAAEPSVVLTVAKLSVGSVLKEGDTLFTLMPANAPLDAELHIAPRDIAFVRPGDPCVLKLEAFNFIEHGIANGAIRWISEGAFTTDDNGQAVKADEAYYKARCSVDPSGLYNVPASFRLIPGMTLSGDIKVGTRSAAFYLMGGFMRGLRESMREPR
jgi:hemolysin D